MGLNFFLVFTLPLSEGPFAQLKTRLQRTGGARTSQWRVQLKASATGRSGQLFGKSSKIVSCKPSASGTYFQVSIVPKSRRKVSPRKKRKGFGFMISSLKIELNRRITFNSQIPSALSSSVLLLTSNSCCWSFAKISQLYMSLRLKNPSRKQSHLFLIQAKGESELKTLYIFQLDVLTFGRNQATKLILQDKTYP